MDYQGRQPLGGTRRGGSGKTGVWDGNEFSYATVLQFVPVWNRICKRKKKCSFIKAGFYLNDAFQLNSLKLLLPPQNVSISKQGALGSFHFADRKRKRIEKTCRLFKSHHQPLDRARHLWCFIPKAHLFPKVWRDFFGITAFTKKHKNIRHTDMCKSTKIWKKIHRSFPLFPISLLFPPFFCLFFWHILFGSYFRTKASYSR